MCKEIRFDYNSITTRYDPSNRLDAYFDALLWENERVNLVSRETMRSDLRRLAAESLVPLNYISSLDKQKDPNLLDIGSGGGFPSFPLLLSGTFSEGTLIERTGKKAKALSRMAEKLSLPATVIGQNLDEIKLKGKFDFISIRLVTLDKRIITKIIPHLSVNGTIVYYFKPEISLLPDNFSAETYSYSSGSGSTNKFFSLISKKI